MVQVVHDAFPKSLLPQSGALGSSTAEKLKSRLDCGEASHICLQYVFCFYFPWPFSKTKSAAVLASFLLIEMPRSSQ